MEAYKVSKTAKNLKGTIPLTASKSESNRVLIIQALCEENIIVNNLAEADDTQRLRQLIHFDSEILNVGAAGTSMRFLTAFLACKEGTRILTGSDRMKQRPINILVDALRKLGAEIEYLENEGFPPIKITGKKLTGKKIDIDGNISSQYISALLLIAPSLPNGLTLNINGPLISKPYVNMTVELMKYFGADVTWKENSIIVLNHSYKAQAIFIEPDWSAASYWYEMAALAEDADLTITGLRKNTLQGDAIIASIFESFGVETTFTKVGIHLKKRREKHQILSTNKENLETQNKEYENHNLSSHQPTLPVFFNYDFSDCPDIAQTVAVTMAALNIPGTLSGLQSLRIKETDRIVALQTELSKIGIKTEIKDDTLIIPSNSSPFIIDPIIKTYDDHRMAMAFAPLALKIKNAAIENPQVVNKSYPGFWKDLKSVGFEIVSV